MAHLIGFSRSGWLGALAVLWVSPVAAGDVLFAKTQIASKELSKAYGFGHVKLVMQRVQNDSLLPQEKESQVGDAPIQPRGMVVVLEMHSNSVAPSAGTGASKQTPSASARWYFGADGSFSLRYAAGSQVIQVRQVKGGVVVYRVNGVLLDPAVGVTPDQSPLLAAIMDAVEHVVQRMDDASAARLFETSLATVRKRAGAAVGTTLASALIP